MSVDPPDLYVCEIKESRLIIPGETRSRWMACPIRAPEWRSILQKFDSQWAAPLAESPHTPGATAPTVEANVNGAEGETGGEEGEGAGTADDFSWDAVFADEPTTKSAMETKYGAASHKFTLNSNENVIAVILEGPKLFLLASGDTTLSNNQPILCFGAGSWLLDSKADSWMQESLR